MLGARRVASTGCGRQHGQWQHLGPSPRVVPALDGVLPIDEEQRERAMTIPGRRRSDTDRLGDSTPGSDDSPNRPHGWVKKLVIPLAVVIVIVVAAETIVSAVLKPPVVRHTSRLDYQSGNFSQWSEQQLHRFEQEAIVTSPARRGYPQTARFTVAPGDQTSGQTGLERAEVAADDARTGDPAEGQDQWFAWSSFFPTGTHVDMPSGWL